MLCADAQLMYIIGTELNFTFEYLVGLNIWTSDIDSRKKKAKKCVPKLIYTACLFNIALFLKHPMMWMNPQSVWDLRDGDDLVVAMVLNGI